MTIITNPYDTQVHHTAITSFAKDDSDVLSVESSPVVYLKLKITHKDNSVEELDIFVGSEYEISYITDSGLETVTGKVISTYSGQLRMEQEDLLYRPPVASDSNVRGQRYDFIKIDCSAVHSSDIRDINSLTIRKIKKVGE